MLKHLYIKNFTLIDELDIELHQGFSVITGETGAGKSIVLGAIGLLLGQRADSKTVKQGTDKCVIEAHFDLSRYPMHDFFEENDIEEDASDTIIRRELTATGKSRAFINDTPVSLAQLKELGEQLVDVHSQHQNLLLGKHDFQLSVLDVIANDSDALSQYQQTYTQYQHTAQRLAALKEETERNRQNQDFLQFQFEELTNARLTNGEQEELEQQSETMEHAEDIKSALYEASTALSGDERGIVSSLKSAVSSLNGISSVMPAVAELAARLDSSYIELKDVANEVDELLERTDFDPSELDAVNNRLDRIYELEKKYHASTVDELLEMLEDLKTKLNAIENDDDVLAQLEAELAAIGKTCEAQANKLTKLRQQAAAKIEKEMLLRLVPLGMPHVRFQINITQDPLGRNGQDKVSFLFSANTSTPLQPVSQVASGGEIARVMLAMKAMISGAVKLPTIIFDEIDTGVSGKIAEQMAHIMREMGRCERQVLSITHLPQIASKGSHHYKVYKKETPNGTTSHMEQLSDEERVSEIAQMLSGSDVSEAAMQNARELLKN